MAASFAPAQYTPSSALVVNLVAHQYTWGTHLRLVDTYPSGWSVVAGSMAPVGTVSGNTVVWDLAVGNDLCESFSYSITPPANASTTVAFGASFTFSSDFTSQAGTLNRSVSPTACAPPPAPALASPGRGQILPAGTTSVTLTWAAASGATSYDVSFGTASPPPFFKNLSTTSVAAAVSSGQTYYFKVAAKNGCGSTSSAVWSFGVAACASPGTPSLLSPADGASVSGSSVGLSWSAAANASGYEVRFGTSNPPPSLRTVATTGTSVTVAPGLTYFWQIRAQSSCGSVSSPVRSFSTVSALPFTASDLHVVSGAHAPGIGGTAWRTDLEVCNRAATQGSFTVALLKRGQPNPSPVSKSYTLDAGKCIRYTDALMTLFGYSGAGSLRLVPTSGTLVASSRTYNQTPSGSYGGFAFIQRLAQAVTPDREGLLIQLGQSALPGTGFRTNVAFSNLTAVPVVALVDLYASTGQLLGTRSVSLGAYEVAQVNEIFKLVTSADVPDGFAVVRTSTPGGALLAEASVIDNRTGDVAIVQPVGP